MPHKIPASDLLSEWKLFLENQKLGLRTIHEYTKLFLTLPDELNKKELNLWINRHNSHVARAVLRKFLEFLESSEQYPDELKVLKDYKIPRIRGREAKKVIRILTREQVDELAASAPDKRTEIMILTTFYLGLRKKELLGLRFKNIDWNNYEVRISSESAKGKKERLIPLPEHLGGKLSAYFDCFPKETIEKAHKDNARIFTRSYPWWQKILAEISEKHLGYPINPHALRHSCGRYLKEKGLDLDEIAEVLGHDQIETTKIYARPSKEHIKREVNQAFDEYR